VLFDLRGRGRRRTVQVIYLFLALLMGGGLVLFGIGGNTNGGLFDAITGNGGGGGNEQIEKDAKNAREAATRDPRNPRVWAVLAEKEYQLAGVDDGFKEDTGQFTGDSRADLVAAERAWDKHLALAGEKPNANTAAIMRNVFSQAALNKPDKAVRAQEIVIEANPNPGFGDYANLAVLAYQAGQSRKGDLAAKKAEDLAPKEQRATVKQSIEAAKTQAITSAAGAGGAGGASTPATGG
jgi:hypothetical protein